MTTANNKAQGAVTPRASNKLTKQSKPKSDTNKPPKKIHRITGAFARGESLDLIIAQQKYHDRSLHSTVSEIEHDYQIPVAREWQVIPGFRGESTRCRRYWMNKESQEKAKKRLEVLA